MGDVHRGSDIRGTVQADALKAALIEHIKRRKRRGIMNPVKATDGKKFNTGNIIAWISAVAVLMNLSPDQVDMLKEIVNDTGYVYGLVLGAVIAAVGLAHKIIKVAGPVIEWFHNWSIRRATK